MKLFGEYLIECGLITPEQLLKALIAQLEEQPSVAKIVLDAKILDEKQILNILKKQVEDQNSFVEAARTLSVWSQDKTDRLYTEMADRRRPLGEVLVHLRILDMPAITRALDDFFGERMKEQDAAKDKEPSASMPSTQSVTPTAEQSETSAIPSETSVSGVETGLNGTSQVQYSEVLEHINDNYLHLASRLIESMSSGQLTDMSLLKEMFDETHKIQGAAQLFEFSAMSDFLNRAEGIMSEILARSPANLGSDVVKKAGVFIQSFRQVVTAISEALRSGVDGAKVFTDGPTGEQVKLLNDSMTILEFDISMIEKGGA